MTQKEASGAIQSDMGIAMYNGEWELIDEKSTMYFIMQQSNEIEFMMYPRKIKEILNVAGGLWSF